MSNEIAKGYIGEMSAYIEISLKLEKLEQRMDELERRQYEFASILRDIAGVVKRHHDTLDAVIKAEGAAESKS